MENTPPKAEALTMGGPIVIHSADHAKAALAAATHYDVDVTLLSPPGAVAYLGATVFRDMVASAAAEFPDARYTAVLDCGDEPGLALGSFRHGIQSVRVHVQPEIRAKLAEVAEKRGATVYDGDEPVLDLMDMTNPGAACLAWLMALDTTS